MALRHMLMPIGLCNPIGIQCCLTAQFSGSMEHTETVRGTPILLYAPTLD
jgi:hypothetical protein